jgi:lipopolysaccharide/colanic/teichoic acid biosynthesis glycosyltransferase
MEINEENLIAVSSTDVTVKEEIPSVYIRKRPIYSVVKRILDIIFSIVSLVVLFVPLLIIALIIVIDSPGASPIYAQTRVGKNGRKFKFYKFRSMVPNAEQMLEGLLSKNEMTGPAFKIKDDPRVTRFGRFIRKTSIDELPQLWNVLKGDMSLVGPRPLIPNEEDIHKMRDRFGVYNIRPGVTGLAQINGRDTISPAEKVRWDVCYLEHFGLIMDLKILFATVPKVFGHAGVVEGYGSHGEYAEKTESTDKNG